MINPDVIPLHSQAMEVISSIEEATRAGDAQHVIRGGRFETALDLPEGIIPEGQAIVMTIEMKPEAEAPQCTHPWRDPSPADRDARQAIRDARSREAGRSRPPEAGTGSAALMTTGGTSGGTIVDHPARNVGHLRITPAESRVPKVRITAKRGGGRTDG